mgnify:CR=1 FL=1
MYNCGFIRFWRENTNTIVKIFFIDVDDAELYYLLETETVRFPRWKFEVIPMTKDVTQEMMRNDRV